MNSEILEINEINNNECEVVYKILNKRKEIIYKKNSKKFANCLNDYLKKLENDKKNLEVKNNNNYFWKKLATYIIMSFIALIIVYVVITKSFGDNQTLNIISYICCLLLLYFSFLAANFINYKSDLLLESDYLEVKKDISKIKKLKKDCKL